MNLNESLSENFLILREDLDKLIFPPLEAGFSILDQCIASIPGDKEEVDLLASLTSLGETIKPYVYGNFDTADFFRFDETVKSYNSQLEKIISQEQKIIRKEQDADRITLLKDDRFFIKSVKTVKRLHFYFRRSVYRIFNFWKKQASFHLYQTIPHWQLIRYVYRTRMIQKLIPSMQGIFSNSCSLYAEMHDLFDYAEKWYLLKLYSPEKINGDPGSEVLDLPQRLHKAGTAIPALKGKMHDELKRINDEINAEFEQLMSICGTFEFPASRLWPRRINAQYREIAARTRQLFSGWGRNHWLLFEDWRFDSKMLSYVLNLIEAGDQVRQIYELKIKDGLASFFQAQDKLAQEFIATYDERSLSRRAMNEQYRTFKFRSSSVLIRKISEFQRAQIDREIQKIHLSLSYKASTETETSTIARSFQPHKLVRDRDIVEVKPMQLISVDIVPRLANKLSQITEETKDMIEQLIALKVQITGILEFGMGAVIRKDTTNKTDGKDIKQSIKESYSRATNKKTDSESIIENLDELIYKQIPDAISSTIDMLVEMQNSDSVLALNLKLAQAKTIQTIKNFGKDLGNGLKSSGAAAVRAPKKIFDSSVILTGELRKKIGYSAKPVHISTELSDFLSRTDTILSGLPYIYQRLYFIEPLEDELFFVERKEVLEKIRLAFDNWVNNGYSPLALVGEKGAGASTALNIFQKRTEGYQFFRIRNNGQIFDVDTFVQHISRGLGLENIRDFEALKDHLVELPQRSIIILEDIQRYYLRTVHGYRVLKKIFELISATNQNILWLTSCTIYAWQYLDRVISISAYFGFVVTLDDMDDEDIQRVIDQRHRISGYQIRYLPNKIQIKNRKLMHMTEEKRQDYLSKSYQSSLARFARGNISLALVHWIRSTSEIQEKTVEISSIYEPDNIFFEYLPVDHLLTLHVLLIHDGLSVEHLSIVLNMDQEETQRILFQLFDDGILGRNKDIYFLNPLIYRLVVNFLTLKNFLH